MDIPLICIFTAGTVKWLPSDLELSPTTLRVDLCTSTALMELVPMSIPSRYSTLVVVILACTYVAGHSQRGGVTVTVGGARCKIVVQRQHT